MICLGCWGEISSKVAIYTKPCNHIFCKKCADKSFAQGTNMVCPFCDNVLPKDGMAQININPDQSDLSKIATNVYGLNPTHMCNILQRGLDFWSLQLNNNALKQTHDINEFKQKLEQGDKQYTQLAKTIEEERLKKSTLQSENNSLKHSLSELEEKYTEKTRALSELKELYTQLQSVHKKLETDLRGARNEKPVIFKDLLEANVAPKGGPSKVANNDDGDDDEIHPVINVTNTSPLKNRARRQARDREREKEREKENERLNDRDSEKQRETEKKERDLRREHERDRQHQLELDQKREHEQEREREREREGERDQERKRERERDRIYEVEGDHEDGHDDIHDLRGQGLQLRADYGPERQSRHHGSMPVRERAYDRERHRESDDRKYENDRRRELSNKGILRRNSVDKPLGSTDKELCHEYHRHQRLADNIGPNVVDSSRRYENHEDISAPHQCSGEEDDELEEINAEEDLTLRAGHSDSRLPPAHPRRRKRSTSASMRQKRSDFFEFKGHDDANTGQSSLPPRMRIMSPHFKRNRTKNRTPNTQRSGDTGRSSGGASERKRDRNAEREQDRTRDRRGLVVNNKTEFRFSKLSRGSGGRGGAEGGR